MREYVDSNAFVALSGEEFLTAVTPVVEYTADETTRYNLCAVHVKSDGYVVKFEATNGHAAFRSTVDLRHANEAWRVTKSDHSKVDTVSTMLSPKQVDKVLRLLKLPGKDKRDNLRTVTVCKAESRDKSGVVVVTFEDGCVVRVGSYGVVGKFPSLDLVIPKRDGVEPCVCLTANLLTIVDRVKSIKPKRRDGYLTVFDFGNKYSSVDSRAQKLGVSVLTTEYQPDNPEQALKYHDTLRLSEIGTWLPGNRFGVQQKYMLPGIKALKEIDSEAKLWFSGQDMPLVIANCIEWASQYGVSVNSELVVMPVKM